MFRLSMWPWGGTTVINNYPGGGYGGGCCGGGWMGKMMMFGMFSNFMTNMFQSWRRPQPPQQYSMYPGLQLNNCYNPMLMGGYQYALQNGTYPYGGGDFDEYSDLLQIQKTFEGKYRIAMLSDGTVFATDKNGKITKANSVEEMLEKLNELAEKTTKETDDDEPVKKTKKTKEADDGDDGDGAGAGSGDDEEKVKARWVRASQSDNETFKAWGQGKFDGRSNGELAASFVTNKILDEYGITTDHKDKLKEALIEQNPSVFEKNGNFANKPIYSRLDIPSKEQVLAIVSDLGEPVGPKGWDTYNSKDCSKFSKAKNVDEVINTLLNGGFGGTVSPINLHIGDMERKKLKQDLIDNNKEIFDKKTGNIKEGSDLKKLVVPYVYQLQNDYKCTVTSLVTKGWVSAAKNPNDKAKIQNYITNKKDAANAAVDELAALYRIKPGTVTDKIRNRIRKDIIYFNFSCFNEDGSLKDGFNIDKLDYPNKDTFLKYGCKAYPNNNKGSSSSSEIEYCPAYRH